MPAGTTCDDLPGGMAGTRLALLVGNVSNFLIVRVSRLQCMSSVMVCRGSCSVWSIHAWGGKEAAQESPGAPGSLADYALQNRDLCRLM